MLLYLIYNYLMASSKSSLPWAKGRLGIKIAVLVVWQKHVTICSVDIFCCCCFDRRVQFRLKEVNTPQEHSPALVGTSDRKIKIERSLPVTGPCHPFTFFPHSSHKGAQILPIDLILWAVEREHFSICGSSKGSRTTSIKKKGGNLRRRTLVGYRGTYIVFWTSPGY